jgi:hypothetical protein
VTSGERAAAPGRFATARVGGGDLAVDDQFLFPREAAARCGARVVLDRDAGPVLVDVRNTVQMRGTVVSAPGAAPEVLVAYVGSDVATLKARFDGLFVAPNALLRLRAVTCPSGAFFAKDLQLGAGARVSLQAPHPRLDGARAAGEPQPNPALLVHRRNARLAQLGPALLLVDGGALVSGGPSLGHGFRHNTATRRMPPRRVSREIVEFLE